MWGCLMRYRIKHSVFCLLFFILFSQALVHSRQLLVQPYSLGVECEHCEHISNVHIPKHLQKAHNAIIRTWTGLDLLRSVRIAPEDRADFAHAMFDDLVTMLTDLTVLSSSCRCCTDYCRKQSEEIGYLEEMLTNVTDAFQAVFSPVKSELERTLESLLLRTLEEMDSFKQVLKL